uniref:EGF-like domain-containing protein n=1 Tax=Dendroctonus ponderosae TaxID=77166 RepID=A0AAR5P2K7_DENPD
MDIVRKFDLVTFSFLVLLMIVANLEAALLGDHVCQKEIIVSDLIPTWTPKNQTIRTYQWCMSIPPRCSVYSTRFENEFRLSFINVTTSIETCCEGFKEENNVCVSICGNCLNGLCSNSSCICRSGWDGPECENPILPTELSTLGPPNASTESTPNTQKEFSFLLPFATPTTPLDGLQQLIPEPPEDILDTELPFNPASTSSMEYSDVELESSGSTSRSTLEAEVAVKKLDDIDDKKENPSADVEIFQEETIVQSTPTPISVLIKPLAQGHQEEQRIPKEALMGQKYEKRASVENLTQNSRFSVTEASHQHLIYSICAASLISFVVLVTVVTLYAMRASRKKIETSTKSGNQEIATVAVYTSSIFHSPLPDPPIFENPTYLAAISREPNLNRLGVGLDAPELNLSYPKQANHLKSDVLHYLYDHPPSTGSYRASSEVDTLSQYNFSQKYLPVSISEPVYDEIPSKVDEVEPRNGEPKNDSDRTADSHCLYMNTCARTKF